MEAVVGVQAGLGQTATVEAESEERVEESQVARTVVGIETVDFPAADIEEDHSLERRPAALIVSMWNIDALRQDSHMVLDSVPCQGFEPVLDFHSHSTLRRSHQLPS